MNRLTPSNSASLKSIAGLFLKLGFIAFGGPAAHIAMMEDEVVRRRQWLTREQFLDLLGATNLIPGPNSTEMAIHIGHQRGGWPGLMIAGACFILPAMFIVLGCSWAYVQLGKLPQAQAILYGIKPVIIAIVAQALWGFGQTAIKTMFLACVAAGSVVLYAAGVHELLLLFLAGALVSAAHLMKRRSVAQWPVLVPLAAATSASGAAATAASFSMPALFFFFLKVGSVLFGSGYVLLAFLRADLVERWGWLTEAQLLDAVAIGQLTPGPVFTTATFIGYILGGTWGAVVATIGIFLPAFVFVAISGPLVPKIRKSPATGAFLDGVIVASLAVMAGVTWQLTTAAVVDGITLAVGIASAILLFRYRLNSAWLILGGAVVGGIKLLAA